MNVVCLNVIVKTRHLGGPGLLQAVIPWGGGIRIMQGIVIIYERCRFRILCHILPPCLFHLLHRLRICGNVPLFCSTFTA